MCHYEEESTFLERVRLVDPSLARRIAQWQEEELPTEHYKDLIRELMEGLDECRGWVGREGDEAAQLYNIVSDEYESMRD